MMTGIVLLVRTTILSAVNIYTMVIFVYVLMSWLPNHAYGRVGDVYNALGRLCEPYLSLFRRIIPPIGGMMDISPIVAVLVLQLAAQVIARLL